MSYIVSFTNLKNSVIMSDGRACSYNGEIIGENFEKVRSLSRNVILGNAGDINAINTIYSYVSSLKLKEDAITSTNISELIYDFMDKNSLLNLSSFIVSGINNDNEMSVYSFGKGYYGICRCSPTNENVCIISLTPSDYNKKEDLFNKYLTNGSAYSVEDAMSMAIREMSKLSHFVNDVTYKACVSLYWFLNFNSCILMNIGLQAIAINIPQLAWHFFIDNNLVYSISSNPRAVIPLSYFFHVHRYKNI